MNCPRCNAFLRDEDAQCSNCGLNLMEWFRKLGEDSDIGQEESPDEPGETEAPETDPDYENPYGDNDMRSVLYGDIYADIREKRKDISENSNSEETGEAKEEESPQADGQPGEESPAGKPEDGEIQSQQPQPDWPEVGNQVWENAGGEALQTERSVKPPLRREDFAESESGEEPSVLKEPEAEGREEKIPEEDVRWTEYENGPPVFSSGPWEAPRGRSKIPAVVIALLVAVGLWGAWWYGENGDGFSAEIFGIVRSQTDSDTKDTEKSQDSAAATVADASGVATVTESPVSVEEDPESDVTSIPTPAETATPVPSPTPTETPAPTPTPDPATVWEAKASRAEQEEVMTEGTWLDRPHMASLMDASGARYGLYVMDLTNCTCYGIGESDTPLPASALIGIPIMFTIADGITSGTYSMDTPVIFHYTFANGRGEIKSSQDGQSLSLGYLLQQALRYSDNNALNSLIDYLTLDTINTTCANYGYTSVDMQRKLISGTSSLDNYISPMDAAMMLNAIYQNNFQEINRDFLKDYFKIASDDTANKGMYPACCGADLFLNLNGITDSRYNEVGLVVNGEEVFIMAVMTVDGKQENSAPCVYNEAAYVLANLTVGER